MKSLYRILNAVIFLVFLVSANTFCADDNVPDKETISERPAVVSPTEDSDKLDWYIIDSGYMTIYCDLDVNLKAVAKKLSRRSLFVARVYDPNPVSAPAEKVAYMLDRLLKRVKDVLDMRPKMDLKIKIFKDREALNEEYCRIFGNKPDYKAFYIFRYNAIYTSEEDISDSVIAHEMGHAVVDHYFSVIPPEKVREVLAQYVDLHLEED